MPYEVINSVDGEPIGYRTVKGAEDADNPALVFETIPEGAVWDAANARPRQRTRRTDKD